MWNDPGAPRETIWTLREHLGSHFGTSGAPRDAIFAPRNDPGRPWEKQDGHEVANNRSLVELGVISGLVSVSFWSQNYVFLVICKLVSKFFFSDFWLELSTCGTSKSLCSHGK